MECSDCMAWHRMENQPEWGECHRHAPSPRTGPDSSAIYGPFNLRGIWPYTRAVDFCYEYIEPVPILEIDEDGEMELEDAAELVDQALIPERFSPQTAFGTEIAESKSRTDDD